MADTLSSCAGSEAVSFNNSPLDPALTLGNGSIEYSRQAGFILETAQQRDVPLTMEDIAIWNGDEAPSRRENVVDWVKQKLPERAGEHDLLASRESRVGRALAAVVERAYADYEDFEAGADLYEWLEGLSVEEKESLVITGGTPADPLVIHTGNELSFSLGYHFNFAVDRGMPESVREKLASRKEFWDAMGVSNGVEAISFVDEHFETYTVDEQSVEMRWLQATNPEAYERVEPALKNGELQQRRLKRIPESQLDGMRGIANRTQHSFYSNWVPGLILEDVAPTISSVDRQTNNGRVATQIQLLDAHAPTSLTEAMQHHALRKALENEIDFDKHVSTLQKLRDMNLGLITEGDLPHADLDQANAVFAAGLGRMYTLDQLKVGISNRSAENLLQILRPLAAFVPAATLMESSSSAIIRDLSKTFGSVDDLTAEIVGIKDLREHNGYEREEAIRRAKVIVPVAATAFILGLVVNKASLIDPHLGAATYQLSSTVVSMATTVLNGRKLATEYQALVLEDKVPGVSPETTPSRFDGYKAAYQEIRFTNTTRVGIAEASIGSVVAATALGRFLFASSLLYVPAGSVETVNGVARNGVQNWRSRARQHTIARRELQTVTVVPQEEPELVS